jgi:hypothetical protein
MTIQNSQVRTRFSRRFSSGHFGHRRHAKLRERLKKAISVATVFFVAELFLVSRLPPACSLLQIFVNSLPQATGNREAFLAFLSFETRLIVHIVFRKPFLRGRKRFEIVVMVH